LQQSAKFFAKFRVIFEELILLIFTCASNFMPGRDDTIPPKSNWRQREYISILWLPFLLLLKQYIIM